MADTKISDLTAVVTPADTDEFAVNQGGTSKKETRSQILSDAYRVGGTDVAVTDGGTGSSTASAARTALGLEIGTDVASGVTGRAALLSAAPDGSGLVFPDVVVGATNGRRIEGLGVTDGTTLDADATWHLVFEPPGELPTGTAKLVIWSRSLGTGDVIVNPTWASVADGENPDTITLTAEGAATITLSATAWEYNEITLDADTIVAGELIVMDLIFEDTSNTATAVSIHLVSVIWE